MKISAFDRIVSFFVLFWLAFPLTHAIGASAALLKAKQEADAKGYLFFSTHDDIVQRAKKEGKIRVMTGLEKDTFEHLVDGFRQKYPFIPDIRAQEITVDAFQRVILEVKSGQAKGWDIAYIPPEYGKDYIPYLMKSDLLGMAQQ